MGPANFDPVPSASGRRSIFSEPLPAPLENRSPAMADDPVIYAGFWVKFLAVTIDAILLTILIMTLRWACPELFIQPWPKRWRDAPDVQDIILCWLYFAGLESSALQGTLGKLAQGLLVTDLAGNRISFKKASLRYLASVLSAIAFDLGYIAAIWNRKKQCWHDRIVGTLVLERRARKARPQIAGRGNDAKRRK